MKYINSITVVLILVGLVLLGYLSLYVVDEREQAVVTQFRKVIGKPVTESGLKFKLPYQSVTYFPKNLQEWDGIPGQIPTVDKKFIWVDTFARWKIVDAVRFFETVTDKESALSRLDDIIDPAVRNLITSYSLIEAVRKSNRELDSLEALQKEGENRNKRETYRIAQGRVKITRMIMEQAQPKLDKFGIELVDVKIKRINYVEDVRKSVYGRMIAERKQMAEKFRSEGKGEASKILGKMEKELKRIKSEAYRTAQEKKGTADADSTKIFAEAYGIDPDFYSFIKTLEVYNESLKKDTSVILSTDSEFLKYFKGFDQE